MRRLFIIALVFASSFTAKAYDDFIVVFEVASLYASLDAALEDNPLSGQKTPWIFEMESETVLDDMGYEVTIYTRKEGSAIGAFRYRAKSLVGIEHITPLVLINVDEHGSRYYRVYLDEENYVFINAHHPDEGDISTLYPQLNFSKLPVFDSN